MAVNSAQLRCRSAHSGCSIYILDLASFAKAEGYPLCHEEKFIVNKHQGVVYLPSGARSNGIDVPIEGATHHMYGTHSAPWYLKRVRLLLLTAC